MGLRTLHRVLLAVGVGTMLAVMVAVVPAGASPLHVYPPSSRPYGSTYVQWEMRYFRFIAAIPASKNPASGTDLTGADCAIGQSGPVWYVPNTGVGTSIQCTVPAGKALLLVPIEPECSTAEGNGNTYEALRSCVERYVAAIKEVGVTVDGAHLTDLLTRFLFQTPLFTYTYPADFVWNTAVGHPGTTKSVAEGVYVMLAPLAAGHHTVVLSERMGAPWVGKGTYAVTYQLTIGG
jgi:hypothetical protein